MKSSSISEWEVGDQGITNNGEVVTVDKVFLESRMVRIAENLEKKLYIPAHGEIQKLSNRTIRLEEK